MIAPAGAGGGWDGFTRSQQSAMRVNGIVNNAQVVNIPDAGGTIGLGRFSTMHGQADTIMVTGSVMVGGIELNDSPVDLSDVRPIARLSDDYDAIVVPADQDYAVFVDGPIPLAIYLLLALALVISAVGRVRATARTDT